MAAYLAHDALRLPAASLLANSGLCVNIEASRDIATPRRKRSHCQGSHENINDIYQ